MTTATFEAGVYDIPEDVYHADPVPGGSLSSTGARKLLPPSCPARFRYEQDHPIHKDVFDFGTAAHKLVLGAGKPLAVLDAEDWRSKAAREWREAVRAEGSVPLLTAEHEQVQDMAAAIRNHPLASALLCRGDVMTEQSYFWPDPEYGIWRRARFDAFRQGGGDGGRLIITDYKTTASADPASFAKSVANFGYHQQAAWYLDAADGCMGVATDAAFLFVAQEKAPPYLVTVCELDGDAIDAGDALNRRAMEIYRDCIEADAWPGYQPENDIALITLPPWARRHEGEYA
jgi:PDDEXK-like domain of unknown function (DUF3799)